MARTKNPTCRYPISHRLHTATVSNVPKARREILPAAASGRVTPVPVTSSTPVLKRSKKQKSPAESSSAAPASVISHPVMVTTPATVVSKTVLASQPISVVITTPAAIDIPSYQQSPSPPELTIDEGPGPSQPVTISVAPTSVIQHPPPRLSDPAIRKGTTLERPYAGKRRISHKHDIQPMSNITASRLLKYAKFRKMSSPAVSAPAPRPQPTVQLTTITTTATAITTTATTATTTTTITTTSTTLATTSTAAAIRTDILEPMITMRDIMDAHISATITSDVSDSASNSESISAMTVHPPRPTTISRGTQTQWGNFAAVV